MSGPPATGDARLRFALEFAAADGRLWGAPDMRFVSGTRGTWHLRIINAGERLAAGAEIVLVRAGCQFAYRWQQTHPERRDYCTLEANSGARLELLLHGDSVEPLRVKVVAGAFEPGDELLIRLGDRRAGSVGSEVFWSATEGRLWLGVDRDGSGQREGVTGNPITFSIVHQERPHRIQLLGPSIVAVGESFAVHAAVFDSNGNVIVDSADEWQLEAPESVSGLPERIRLRPADCGVAIIDRVLVRQQGVIRLTGTLAGHNLTVLSNPIVVQTQPDHRIYWGDVHAHGWGDSTMYLMYLRSDKLDPDARHRQGRRVGRFDFACPSPMSADPDQRAAVWQAYLDACRRHDEPGRYVPFAAYEIHPTEGDRQLIFKDGAAEPAPPAIRAPFREAEDRYAARDDVFMQVHIGGAPPRWDQYLPECERLLEVCSGFGCAEWLLQRALALGYQPAICGASDLHLGLMGGPRAVEPFRGRFGQKYPMTVRDCGYGQGPLTAAIAPELTRDALWTALSRRASYATSGARIALEVTLQSAAGDGARETAASSGSALGAPSGGKPVAMGEALAVEGPLLLRLRCHGCAPIRRLDLICGTCRVRTWRPQALDVELEERLAARDLPGDWLYVRVEQEDGEWAWSSPIRLEHGEAPPAADWPAWNEDDAEPIDPRRAQAAAQFLPELLAYLRREEAIERFQELEPVAVCEQSMGLCALFFCRWGEERLPMSIRWFFEFEIPRIRFDWGRRDYGAFDELEWGPRLMAKYR